MADMGQTLTGLVCPRAVSFLEKVEIGAAFPRLGPRPQDE